MTNDETTLSDARSGDEQAFARLTDPYRTELQLHCYRILGSGQDAEDALQETLLAAWRALDQLKETGALRAWLYRIATTRSLNALRARDNPRSLPPLSAQLPEPARIGEITWLEPYPDHLLVDGPDSSDDPAARYARTEAVSLAFTAALQQLAPRQRAALILRDVLGFRAREVAEILGSTEESVTSALKRARATVDRHAAVSDRGEAPLPDSARERELVGRFARAFERSDVAELVTMLTEDVVLTMPPLPLEYEGRAAASQILAIALGFGERPHRLIPTRANGQPAYGCYLVDHHSPIAHAHGLMVLTLAGDEVSAITRFLDNGLLARFGLPRILRDPPPAPPA